MQEKNQSNAKPIFEEIARVPILRSPNGNTVLVSKQKIVQPNGSSTEHLVLTKYKVATDGTQQGDASRVYIPYGMKTDVANAINALEAKK